MQSFIPVCPFILSLTLTTNWHAARFVIFHLVLLLEMVAEHVNFLRAIVLHVHSARPQLVFSQFNYSFLTLATEQLHLFCWLFTLV